MRKHLPRYDFTGRARRESKMHKMNMDLFVKRSTSSARKAKDEADEDFVKRLTHLKLQDKNIKEIENLDLCVSLQVLYLQDNLLNSMTPLNVCKKLTNLHLSRNGITIITGLENATNLRKLFLDGNAITTVSGLESCIMLEELNLDNQKLHDSLELTFEPSTLNTLSGNLTHLSVSGCKIVSPIVFSSLVELQVLNCSNNKIKNAGEVVEVLSGLKELKKAVFSGNPVCKTTKYRETMLINCNNRLSFLDGKEIDRKQRDALIRFAQHRLNRRKQKKAPQQQQHPGDKQQQYHHNGQQMHRQPLAANQHHQY
jgi:protein phosphatase 1 regulatory subunit 42